MADRGIAFSAPMVRALLEGRKTQTRRSIAPQPFIDGSGNFCTPRKGRSHLIWGQHTDGRPCTRNFAEELFRTGDRLWVRETYFQLGHWEPVHGVVTRKGKRQKWRFVADEASVLFEAPAVYRKGRHAADPATPAWHQRLGRFMPRGLSRMTLTITDVRVQRLQEISEEDAAAEGAPDYAAFLRAHERDVSRDETPEEITTRLEWKQRWFAALWRDLRGPESWTANPWIVALTFTVALANIDAAEAARAA